MTHGHVLDDEPLPDGEEWPCTRCGAPAELGEGLCAECQDELGDGGEAFDEELDTGGGERGE